MGETHVVVWQVRDLLVGEGAGGLHPQLRVVEGEGAEGYRLPVTGGEEVGEGLLRAGAEVQE